MKIIAKLFKLILGNLFVLCFLFLPYVVFRFIIPFVWGLGLEPILTQLGLGSSQAFIEFANGKYWAIILAYLLLSNMFTIGFDFDAARKVANRDEPKFGPSDFWESHQDQMSNTLDWYIAWTHIASFPGKLVYHVGVMNLRLIGIRFLKSPFDAAWNPVGE